ncbi:MAG: hypothetical protein ABIJ84_04495 [bacterium]
MTTRVLGWLKTSQGLLFTLRRKTVKTIEQVAAIINENIGKWVQEPKKIVVAVDGYTGSGKTSIANRIAELNPNYLVVHLDDFIRHWKIRKQMMDATHDRSRVFEHLWYRYDALERLVKAFLCGRRIIRLKVYDFDENDFSSLRPFDLSKEVLLIEGVFLLHPQHRINSLWSRSVFLKTKLRKSEARHVNQEKKKWGKDYLPEDHPGSYFGSFKEAYRRYLELCSPEQRADLVIDIDTD